jgi:hypothetical protein
VAPVLEVENLTGISKFWALTTRSLIGKSWKFVDIAQLGPACHAGAVANARTDFSPVVGVGLCQASAKVQLYLAVARRRILGTAELDLGSGVRISSGAPFANYAIAAKIGRFFD